MNPFESQLLFLRIGVLLLLYLFLMSVLVFLWRDLRAAARRVSLPRRLLGQLIVVDAGETGLAPGDTFPLQPLTTLGRGLDNTIVLPEVFASSQHALLALRDAQWWLEDLDSRNGTFLNNHRVAKPAVVHAGDLIGIGRVLLRLEV
jgi:hypothetical protein